MRHLRWSLQGGLALAFLWVFLPRAQALTRGATQTQTQYRDEGRNPIAFAVACTSYTWVTVQSSDTIRRSVIIQAVPTNTVNVCVQAASTATLACTDTLAGNELTPNASITDYSQSAWICQCRTGAACNVKGHIFRDKGDQGDIGNARLQ